MSSMLPPVETAPADGEAPSLVERTLRVFVRPSRAWEGLEKQALWWFPLLLTVVIQAVLVGVTFKRALLPMLVEQWNQAIETGQATAEQIDRIVSFYSSAPGLALQIGMTAVFLVGLALLVALVVWFGIGFVLGARFSFRLALEVVGWAGLVRLPEAVLTYAIGWWQETLKGIHFGLAALLPEMDPPSKVHVGLTVLLDAFSPFVIWFLFVAVLGASVLSGAPRKNVAWVLSVLYIALTVVFSVVAALLAPGA